MADHIESDARFLRTITLGAITHEEWERVNQIAGRLEDAERAQTPGHPSGWSSRLPDPEFMREMIRRGFVRGSSIASRFSAIADRLDGTEERELRVLDWILARAGMDETDDRYQAVHKILRTDEATPLQNAREAYAAEHPSAPEKSTSEPVELGWVAAWPVTNEVDAVIRWGNHEDARTYVRAARLVDPAFCVGRVVRDD